MNTLRVAPRYGLVVVALLLATLVRWLLDPLLGESVPYLSYLAAIAAVGVYAGLGPALLTLVLGSVMIDLLFIPVRFELLTWNAKQTTGMVLYYLAALAIIALTERLRASRTIAQESKREAEERGELLRRITDSMSVLLSYVDRDMHYQYVSAGYEAWFHQSPEEICGQPVAELVGEEAFRQIEPNLKRALAGEVVEVEHALDFKRAGRRRLRVQFFPVRRHGSVEGVSVVIVDVAERHRLAERDAALAAIVTAAQEAIITKDLAGSVTSWNPGAERLYGYGADEMMGVPMDRLAPPERAGESGWIVAEARAGRAIDGFETVRLHRDGRLIDILLSAAPIRDAQGRVTAVAIIERDITARKQAEAAARASEARLQAIIDNSPLVLFIKDLKGRYLLANRSYLQLFNTTAEALLGKTDDDRLPADLAEQFQAHDRQVIASGVSQEFEETAQIDGGIRTYVSTKFPLRDRDGKVYAVCGISTDITEQKRQQAQLQETDRRKDQFLSMLAHELRNPLAPIVNAVQVLRLQGESPSAWAVDVIERQATHLTRLVDDLLDIARINSGRIQLRREVLEMGALLRQTADSARLRFDEREVTLTLALPQEALVVEADEQRIIQIIDNLLDNAAKYSDTGGQVGVELRREAEHCLLRVRDTGIGIDTDYLPRIFDLFEQADTSLDRSGGGLGLGLNLVKRLVEKHGGTVEARSEGLGRGSEFVVRLPLAGARAGAQPDSAAIPASEQARRVLVVEDNHDVAQSMEMLLDALGHEVCVAETGRSGIAAAETFRPHLVLADLGLPDISGFDVARELRARYGSAMRLVAVSGYGQAGYRERAKGAGFDDHLVKPLSLDALRQTLASSGGDNGVVAERAD